MRRYAEATIKGFFRQGWVGQYVPEAVPEAPYTPGPGCVANHTAELSGKVAGAKACSTYRVVESELARNPFSKKLAKTISVGAPPAVSQPQPLAG